MIDNKEKLRRLGVRLRTLFKIKRGGRTYYREPSSCAIPNFWITPFEVYVLAHIKRAHFIMTYDEYAYVDAAVKHTKVFAKEDSDLIRIQMNGYVGVINYFKKAGKTFFKNTIGKDIEYKE